MFVLEIFEVEKVADSSLLFSNTPHSKPQIYFRNILLLAWQCGYTPVYGTLSLKIDEIVDSSQIVDEIVDSS